jgi:hypothetical protein
MATVDGLDDLFNGVQGGVTTVTPDKESEAEVTADSLALVRYRRLPTI